MNVLNILQMFNILFNKMFDAENVYFFLLTHALNFKLHCTITSAKYSKNLKMTKYLDLLFIKSS